MIDIDIPDGTVLDGELIVPGQDGKPDFEAMMERFMSNKSSHQIQFVVFDILYHNNEKVTHLPLLERKKLLSDTVQETKQIVLTKWIEGNAVKYFDLVKQQDLEGIVMKLSDSRYDVSKRGNQWLKVINYSYENCLITGMSKDDFGVLLSFEDGTPAGLMEFMPPAARKELRSRTKGMVRSENDKFIFFDLSLKCKVKYRNLTKKGKLRIPSFCEWVNDGY